MLTQGQKTRAKWAVMLIQHTNDGFPLPYVSEVAKFHAKGDAIAYAIWRAHNIPEGKIHVFEVYNGAKREYRAG